MRHTLRLGRMVWAPMFLVATAIATLFVPAAGAAPDTGRPASPPTFEAAPDPAPGVNPTAVAPALTITLESPVGASQDIPFTGCREGSGCSTFALDDDTDPALSSTMVANALAPGTYTVTQDPITGWVLTDLECSAGATVDLGQRRATITLTGNESVYCQFEGVGSGIRIAVGTDPDTTEPYTFAGCQGSACAEFVLDRNNDDATNPRAVEGPVAPGTYTITQIDGPDRYLDRVNCLRYNAESGGWRPGAEPVDLAQRRLTIVVVAGEAIDCTFHFSRRGITIVQDTPFDDPQDFSYASCRDGSGCGSFVLDDDADPTRENTIGTNDLADGTYVITQDQVPGWSVQSITCTPHGRATISTHQVSVAFPAGMGGNVRCTFRNRTTGLRIVQDTQPDDAQDFGFTGCLGTGCDHFALDDDQDSTLARSVVATNMAPGTYTITQDAVPAWPLTKLVCDTGEVVDLAQRRATVTLTTGELTTCTFTNGQPRVTIVQDTAPDGPQDFTFVTCHQATGCGTVVLDDDTDPGHPASISAIVPTGAFFFSQAEAPGFTRPDISCNGGAGFANGVQLTVAAGAQVTCTFRNEPAGPPLSDATQVATGEKRACARSSDGRLHCWGGLASTVTVGGEPLEDIGAVSLGQYHSCARTVTGQARCWGSNGSGQVGDGTDDTRSEPVAVVPPSGPGPLTGVVQVAGGSNHTCAVLDTGQARCWGSNSAGQLGDGTTTNRLRPVAVSNVDGSGPLTDVVQIAAGSSRTCAVLADGGVRCWGQGALGDGSDPTTGTSAQPVVVTDEGGAPLASAVEVTASTGSSVGHSCARLSTGELRCWGFNNAGQLGDGTTAYRSRAVTVLGVLGPGPLTDVVGLDAGSGHTCARLIDGEARCWGRAGSGELGHGTTPGLVARPVVVVGPDGSGALGDITSISAHHEYTCATRSDGSAWCWGQNIYGTLGTGSNLRWARPVAVLTAP